MVERTSRGRKNVRNKKMGKEEELIGVQPVDNGAALELYATSEGLRWGYFDIRDEETDPGQEKLYKSKWLVMGVLEERGYCVEVPKISKMVKTLAINKLMYKTEKSFDEAREMLGF